jgi:hypothetical protein
VYPRDAESFNRRTTQTQLQRQLMKLQRAS